MKLRLCCVSSGIEGAPDDFFFVVFVVSFLQMMQIATNSSDNFLCTDVWLAPTYLINLVNHAQFFEDATAFHEFFFKMSSSGTT